MPSIEPILFMYGPPGSGKSTAGRSLAQALELPFIDLDHEITTQARRSIPDIFESEGETGFRLRESAVLQEVCERSSAVVALGGGALLDPANRALAESRGMVICLEISKAALQERLHKVEAVRPLLGKASEVDHKLEALLAARAAHYASFKVQVDTQSLTPEQSAWEIQVKLGLFRITGMGKPYDVRIRPGGLDQLGALMHERQLNGPVALVSDQNIAPLYLHRASQSLAAAGYKVAPIILPAGEASKSLASAATLWEEFLKAGLERGSTVVALGGGVISDLVGFAASVYLRGMRWVAAPTSLLAMIDASLGGKTAIDLPQGKNLVGAFHPPALIVADPEALKTLPPAELRNGLAEVLKHGLLRDPGLFEQCARGWEALQSADWTALVRRAMAVKVLYVLADPYEQGERAALNLGHTIGHAIEQTSHFRLRHGEAVAIGMLAAARLSVRTGLAQPALVDQISAALDALGLPRRMPAGMDLEEVLDRMQLDKKKRGGQVRFVLPIHVGKVRFGVPLELDMQTLREVTQ
jgi:shikimate kinase / 3-dehydroquinate synthase